MLDILANKERASFYLLLRTCTIAQFGVLKVLESKAASFLLLMQYIMPPQVNRNLTFTLQIRSQNSFGLYG